VDIVLEEQSASSLSLYKAIQHHIPGYHHLNTSPQENLKTHSYEKLNNNNNNKPILQYYIIKMLSELDWLDGIGKLCLIFFFLCSKSTGCKRVP
jgi:hypothetical protein